VARIAGVDIPRDKRIEIALTYVYGIGLTTAKKILAKTGVNPDTRVKDLDDADVQKLRGAAEGYTLEGDLRRQEGMALKRLQDIGCVRGRRHRAGLPVRGQRTRTNARTVTHRAAGAAFTSSARTCDPCSGSGSSSGPSSSSSSGRWVCRFWGPCSSSSSRSKWISWS